MKNFALVLHIYQPGVQSLNVFKQIYETSYAPLLKIIKNKKQSSFTINIPLSLLDLMETYGYSEWIADLAKLVESGRVEFTGSGAFHPLLSRLPKNIAEDQIVLNEYGLAYYFGKKTGFEGERSVMIKDLKGFFPPEMAVNDETVTIISNLGYEWLLVDSCAVSDPAKSALPLYSHTSGIKIVVRDTALSNIIAFNRGFDIKNAYDAITTSSQDFMVVALDGETFGHHNKEGILYLDQLLDSLVTAGVEVLSISKILSKYSATNKIDALLDSSWGSSVSDIAEGNVLPFWNDVSNVSHTLIWELFSYIEELYQLTKKVVTDNSGKENAPIWKNEYIDAIKDLPLKEALLKQNILLRLLSSDILWWSSKKTLYNGEIVYDKNLLKKHTEFIEASGLLLNDPTITDMAIKIRSALEL